MVQKLPAGQSAAQPPTARIIAEPPSDQGDTHPLPALPFDPRTSIERALSSALFGGGGRFKGSLIDREIPAALIVFQGILDAAETLSSHLETLTTTPTQNPQEQIQLIVDKSIKGASIKMAAALLFHMKPSPMNWASFLMDLFSPFSGKPNLLVTLRKIYPSKDPHQKDSDELRAVLAEVISNHVKDLQLPGLSPTVNTVLGQKYFMNSIDLGLLINQMKGLLERYRYLQKLLPLVDFDASSNPLKRAGKKLILQKKLRQVSMGIKELVLKGSPLHLSAGSLEGPSF